MFEETDPVGISRRCLLTSVAGGSFGAAVAPTVQATGGNDQGERRQLGAFESGFDGWKTNGKSTLRRIERSNAPTVVSSGNYALAVAANGDAFPSITNRKRVREADFVEAPFLIADVSVGRIPGTDSPVRFSFELHHQNGGSVGNGGDGEPVELSEPQTVPQHTSQQLSWDLSSIPERSRETARRLVLRWHADDHPVETGPEGTNRGFDYEGDVFVDNVRLEETRSEFASGQISDHLLGLEFEHGVFERLDVTSRSSTTETGKFVFQRGEVGYRFEILEETKHRFELGERVVKLGEGWA